MRSCRVGEYGSMTQQRRWRQTCSGLGLRLPAPVVGRGGLEQSVSSWRKFGRLDGAEPALRGWEDRHDR